MQISKSMSTNKDNRQTFNTPPLNARTLEPEKPPREINNSQNSASLKKIETLFENKRSKKAQPNISYAEPKSGETSEFLSMKQERPPPKLMEYKLGDQEEFEQWTTIVNQFSKTDIRNEIPQINLNQLPKNEYLHPNQIQNQNQNQNRDRVRSLNPEHLNVSSMASQVAEDYGDAIMQNNFHRIFADIKDSPVDFLEGVKELEKMHKIKSLDEQVGQLKKEKASLENTINNLKTMLVMLATKQKEREATLLGEIESLKEYAATNSEERIQDLRNENKRLKKELENQKNANRELEAQYKQENDNFQHLCSDIEATKKNILEQLFLIKDAKERLNQERKEMEIEKHEVLRMKELLSIQASELLKQNSLRSNPENNYMIRVPNPNESISAQARMNSIKREDSNPKAQTVNQREDPFLLNLNKTNDVYYDNNQRRMAGGKNAIIEDPSRGANLKQQNTKFTETEYENTEEDFGETEREHEIPHHYEDKQVMSRDYASISSQGEEEAPNIKQLRELIKNLEDINS